MYFRKVANANSQKKLGTLGVDPGDFSGEAGSLWDVALQGGESAMNCLEMERLNWLGL